MQSVLVRTINDSARQLARLYAFSQHERTTITKELLAYLKRISVRYKIMSTYLLELQDEYERTRSAHAQSELLEAAMAFKQDSEAFSSVLDPILALSLCETEARREHLYVADEYHFDVAFKLAKAMALPLGVQALLDGDSPPDANRIVSKISGEGIESVLQDPRLDDVGVKNDIFNALKAHIPNPKEREVEQLRNGIIPSSININYLYSRKLLMRVKQRYED